MNTPSQDTQKMLNSLQTAVSDALEKKRRLGQYAVIWADGKPTILNPDDLKKLQKTPRLSNDNQ